MKKRFAFAGIGLAVIALASLPVSATVIPAKMKSKKVQGDLVPAYACDPTDPDPACSNSLQIRSCSDGSGPCVGDASCTGGGTCTEGVITKSNAYGHNCIFESGNFKIQSGKDTQVQLKKVSCIEASPPSQLCGHIASYSTITDLNIDTKGVITPKTCTHPVAGNIAGTANYAIAQQGTLTCDSKGSCKGVLPVVAADPCPDVDKVSQYIRLEVFDGSSFVSIDVGGAVLKGCCGRNQNLVGGGFPVSAVAPCNTAEQDSLAVGGTVVQIK